MRLLTSTPRVLRRKMGRNLDRALVDKTTIYPIRKIHVFDFLNTPKLILPSRVALFLI